MKKIFKAILILAAGFVPAALSAQTNFKPFTLPEIPKTSFSTDTVTITSFGAVEGGLVVNTAAINKAIEAASVKKGVVLIPKGLWLTGPIVLKSNVNLHLQEGALLQFSDNFDHYPLVNSYFEGWETIRCQSPISGKNLSNIAITGLGVIDGAGQAWRPVKRSKMTAGQWKMLVASGGVLSKDKNTWYPSAKSLLGSETTLQGYVKGGTMEHYEKIKDYLRPNMVSIVECDRVLLEGVTFQNSPAWNVHPLMSTNVIVNRVNIRNPWYAQNGDGIDLESCRNGMIVNSTFDVGDDAICIKSGKDEEGRKRGIPTENFLIENCVVYHGHGGFVVGSEMSGGVRNLIIKNCTFLGTDIGLRFKSTRGRGGVVENILIDGVAMNNIPAEAISFNLYYQGMSPIPEPEDEGKVKTTTKEVGENPVADESTPQFRNIAIRNVACKGAARAIYVEGLPEMNVANISFENVNIEATTGIRCVEVDGISFENVNVKSTKGTAFEMHNAKNLSTKNVTLINDGKVPVSVAGAGTKAVNLTGVTGLKPAQVSQAANVSKREVRCSK